MQNLAGRDFDRRGRKVNGRRDMPKDTHRTPQDITKLLIILLIITLLLPFRPPPQASKSIAKQSKTPSVKVAAYFSGPPPSKVTKAD